MYHSNRIETDVETAGTCCRCAGDVRVAHCRQIGGLHRHASRSTLLHPMVTFARQASGNNPDITHDLLSTRSRTGVRPWSEQTCRQRPSTANMHTATSSKTSTEATENHGGTQSCTRHLCHNLHVSKLVSCCMKMKWRHSSTQPLLTHQRLSSALKRIDSMRWTAHLQECLHEIEARREAPLDDALVQCVRIQLIADKAINSALLDVNMELDPYFRPPPNLFAQEMLAQLGRLRSSMGTATWQEGELITVALHQLA